VGADGFSSRRTAQPFLPSIITMSSRSRNVVVTGLAAAGNSNNNDEDYMRWARQARFAEDGDTIVELPRPLGLVLNADAQGNVYVEKVAPKGNAARSGKVCVVVDCGHR
jgi:hypothetical protein